MTAQIVLAAGRSERMGVPKALLDFDGRTALELALAAGAEAGVEESVVVLGAAADRILARHERTPPPGGVRWVRNDDPLSEQFRSLQVGLASLREGPPEAFFIHPVDHPLATAADYRLLIAALSADTTGATLFVLSHGGRRGHPVLCRRSIAGKLLSLGPEATARDVLEKEPILYVLTENAGAREDMDTPEDYQRLLALYRARRP